MEIERQIEDVDAVLVPVGGGGLIAGVAGFMKSRHPGLHVIGCQPEGSCVMAESVRAGKILAIASEPTFADGTAGGLDPDAITFPICRRIIDAFVLLTEKEIAAAMRLAVEQHYMMIEGAAALSIAASLKESNAWRGKRVVLVISGNKVSVNTLKKVLAG